MLFWSYMMVLGALAIAASVSAKFFWWFAIAFGVLMSVGVAVETCWYLRQEPLLGPQPEEKTPTEAPAADSPRKAADLASFQQR